MTFKNQFSGLCFIKWVGSSFWQTNTVVDSTVDYKIESYIMVNTTLVLIFIIII